MKKIIALLFFCLTQAIVYSQDLVHVIFNGASTISAFSFRTDQGVIIKVSADGKVLEWGTEMENYRYNYYPGKLLPYMGRVDNYGAEADAASQGKVKSIGTALLTYYPATETEAKAGKLKSIGRVQFDYYDLYENVALKGKLKMADITGFTYYASHENESLVGKLKTVANTALTYYTSFDDKLIRGKIKSIGNYQYTWYTSNSGTGYQGALKSGNIYQIINGVNYIIF